MSNARAARPTPQAVGKQWHHRLQGNALYALARITQHTGRFQLWGMDQFEAAKDAGKPVILAAWHGMTMLLAGFFLDYFHNDLSDLVLMVPDDWRGSALTHWIRRMRSHPFPMNLKGDMSMGMARQFARLVRLLKTGKLAYITPDGPAGPGFVIKPGVAYLAQKTGATVLPVAGYTRTCYRLNRWDEYMVPYPFSRITLVVGEPVPAPPDVPHQAITEPLTDALHRVAARAAANYYEKRG